MHCFFEGTIGAGSFRLFPNDDDDGDDDDDGCGAGSGAGDGDVLFSLVAFFHKLLTLLTSVYKKQSQMRNEIIFPSKHNRTKIGFDGGCRNIPINKFY